MNINESSRLNPLLRRLAGPVNTTRDTQVNEDALAARQRVATRMGAGAFVLAFVLWIAASPLFGSLPRFASWLALMGFVSFVLSWCIGVCAWHPFLLDPRRYARWLRTLGTFEPETFWGQSFQSLSTWVGGIATVIIGAVVGADLGAQRSFGSMFSMAWQWTGALLALGFIYIWWSRFVVQLAIQHRRALKRGALPKTSKSGTTIWAYAATIWVAGVVLVLAVGLAAPTVWHALLAHVGLA